MKQLQIFKTNIHTRQDVQSVTAVFQSIQHVQEWTIDLDDCDRVLRVFTRHLFPTQAIIALLGAKNIRCEPMACYSL